MRAVLGNTSRCMCGRYTLTRHEKIAEDMQAAVDDGAAQNEWWKARFNVAPTQPAPVVLVHHGERHIEMMRWGLVPFWAGHDGKTAPLMINARLESLNAKQFFRDALERKRCLVPADGFFEWISHKSKDRPAKKQPPQPFYFHARSRELFAFAGLWARTRSDGGEEQHSFTIITGKANDLVRPIHDRMPIIVAPSDYTAWLDPTVDAAQARALLGHPPDGDWIREAVSTWVNKADHDDATCIAPEASTEPSSQGRLFD
jgi:putative SOS response-associated peptidase YedK